MDSKKQLIAFFLPTLSGGGAEKVMLTLAENISNKGFNVELVVLSANASSIRHIPKCLKLINLSSSRAIFSLVSLLKYIKQHKPTVMLSALGHINILAIIAKILSKLDFRIVVSEHAIQGLLAKKSKRVREKLIPLFIKFYYPYSDQIVAVSSGVENSLVESYSIPSNKITTIYNPIIDNSNNKIFNDEVQINSNFSNAKYKIVAVGRLSPEKDYYTLIKAFELIIKSHNVHLIILGEGKERSNLELLIRDRQLVDNITLLGFVEEPSVYIEKCDVLCLSSVTEGFGNVLVEALASGTPVVSTNCPSGPSEILKNGLWGELVPVGDFIAMSQAVIKVLNGGGIVPPIEELLELYGIENITNRYLEVLIPKS